MITYIYKGVQTVGSINIRIELSLTELLEI